jgi:hypothetical protein
MRNEELGMENDGEGEQVGPRGTRSTSRRIRRSTLVDATESVRWQCLVSTQCLEDTMNERRRTKNRSEHTQN